MGAGSDDVSITRSVDLEADVDDVWDAVTTSARLSGWMEGEVDVDVRPGGDGILIEPDGAVRRIRVDEVRPCERLALEWWPEDGSGPASRVVLDLRPVPGGTRLVVTETLHAHPATASAGSARAAGRWDLGLILLGCSLLRPLAACR